LADPGGESPQVGAKAPTVGALAIEEDWRKHGNNCPADVNNPQHQTGQANRRFGNHNNLLTIDV